MLLIIIDWDCLKQDKITFTHGTIVNICIVYEISSSDSSILSRKLFIFGQLN